MAHVAGGAHYMEKFFAPGSVAVIGASATPGKPGNVVIRNILANGYGGRIYLVNPRGGEIEGLKVHQSIADLPDGIDQAIVTLPARVAPETIRALGAKGIEAVVLAASGFAEVDHMGEELQVALGDAIREAGVRVFGPNTTGHVSVPVNFTSSFFPLGKVPRGTVSYITQTGNFSGISLRHIMSAENFGVCRVAGLGNKADVDESDLLDYLGSDAETESIFLYLESIKDPKRFLRIARRVSRHKPVVMLKGGASIEGARAAVVVILMLTDETGVPSYDFITDLAAKYPAKPIYVTFMGQHEHNVAAQAYLEPKGIPAYMLVEEPFEVLGVLARCRAAMGRG